MSGEVERQPLLREIVGTLLTELKNGSGDRDKRRQVEEWMKGLVDKYPEFDVEHGLRDYYHAEAGRLRAEFDKAPDLSEKLNLARSVEGFLEKARNYEERISEKEAAKSKAEE